MRIADTPILQQRLAAILPLPRREGRGEGIGSVQNNPAYSQNTSNNQFFPANNLTLGNRVRCSGGSLKGGQAELSLQTVAYGPEIGILERIQKITKIHRKLLD